MSESLDSWIARELRHAAAQMMRSISPIEVIKERPGFGQVIRPKPGAIVASPVLASYDPDPDYFFHWYRDSAVIVDALRVLAEGSLGSSGACKDAASGGVARGDVASGDLAGSEFASGEFVRCALRHLADFVTFSLGLRELDGRALVAAPAWREKVHRNFVRFLRTDADLAQVHGEAVAADTRVNADGTLDISSWARPQHDGPALRALALVRWLRSEVWRAAGDRGSARKPPGSAPERSAPQTPVDGSVGEPAPDPALDPAFEAAATLLRQDLAFTRAHWREPCFDVWEEELGSHYYTLCVAAAALDEGADWLDARGAAAEAQACRADAAAIRDRLDGYWLAEEGFYRSRLLASGERSSKELDISVVLAAIHADAPGPRHSVRDPRIHATLARLDALFEAEYPINRNRPAARAPALGRYKGDVYYSGGAYYFSTLGAAELCFRAAAAAAQAGANGARAAEPPGAAGTTQTSDTNVRALIASGDAYLETVRAFTPPSGDLSEQFDQRSGEQTSAKHLAWSYAAFITCVAARRAALLRTSVRAHEDFSARFRGALNPAS